MLAAAAGGGSAGRAWRLTTYHDEEDKHNIYVNLHYIYTSYKKSNSLSGRIFFRSLQVTRRNARLPNPMRFCSESYAHQKS